MLHSRSDALKTKSRQIKTRACTKKQKFGFETKNIVNRMHWFLVSQYEIMPANTCKHMKSIVFQNTIKLRK